MKFLKISAIALAAPFIFAACSNQPSQNTATDSANTTAAIPSPTANAATPTDQALDPKKLYTKNCAACHRDSGEGGKMVFEGRKIDPENLTSDKVKKFSDEKIAKYIREGIEDDGMPAFEGKLTEDQIKAIISYIRSDLQKVPTT